MIILKSVGNVDEKQYHSLFKNTKNKTMTRETLKNCIQSKEYLSRTLR